MTSRAKHKVLGKVGYNIVKILGKGAYSKVCLIVNETGKKYACKIIKKKLAGLDFIEKFVYREVEINNMIKHSNIVKVHTILESKDAIYMIMDYCRHGDLLEYIKNFGCFPEENAKNYFKQIVEAVCYLHDHDIAHRDLKCENIFLMWNNQVKLGDFGFSRSCSDGFGQKALSDTFCGSLAYAPPEILKMKKSVSTITLLWPKHSDRLKNLINSLLEPDLDKRITIKFVKIHSWFEESGIGKVKKPLS
ncbi:testis-specific serine/threonine-protein kinase 2-like isoform X2 [Euwallacea fornicatus]|uniref:testis-specific serine/threonine-protein kinase 2-like isoform X2 n=1 Tax=Euwallacea fornicatus TaxID=995702 RepID=UPI00338F2167